MNEISFIVVVPAYNAESYLERAVSSVTQQHYPQCQVVITDDGSTDQTGKIAESLASEYANVHVIHQENSGQLMSRVNAVRFASSRLLAEKSYFLFLDSDDIFLPGSLARIAQLIIEHNCDLLFFGIEQTNETTGSTRPFGGRFSGEPSSKASFYRTVLYDYSYNSVCRKAVSAAIIGDVDYEPYSELRNAEDLVQSLDYYRKAEHVYFSKECFYRYYMNSSSVTHSLTLANYPLDSTVRALTWDFVRGENVWSQSEMNEYALFLLNLLEKKISAIALMDGTAQEKEAVYNKLKKDSFFAELLTMDLPHSRVITCFINNNYAAMQRNIILKRLTKVFKRR